MAKIPGTIKKRTGSPLLRIDSGSVDETFMSRLKRLRAERRSATSAALTRKPKPSRAEAKAEKTAALDGSVETFGEACDLYFERVGQHHDKGGQGAENTAWALDWLKRQLGADRRLADIDDGMVSALVARRRGEKKVRGKTVTNEFVSATTVNRSATEPLRKVLLFARDIGKAPIQKINWRMHVLKEPKERVRELRDEEQVALFDDGLRDDHKPLVEIALLLGLRRGELIGLKWEHVDFGARRSGCSARATLTSGCRCCRRRVTSCGAYGPTLTVIRSLCLPSSPSGPANMAAGPSSRAIAIRTPPRAGNRLFRRAVEEAGIKDFRMHDNRHTAASRLHREIGLVGVQEVLAAQADRDDAQIHPCQQRGKARRLATGGRQGGRAAGGDSGRGGGQRGEARSRGPVGGPVGAEAVKRERVKRLGWLSPPVPQTSALTGLRYTPTALLIGSAAAPCNALSRAWRLTEFSACARIRSASPISASASRSAASSSSASFALACSRARTLRSLVAGFAGARRFGG